LADGYQRQKISSQGNPSTDFESNIDLAALATELDWVIASHDQRLGRLSA